MPPASTKTALIIGASRGLGLGMARELLAYGWHVVGTVRDAARRNLFSLADRSRGKLSVETVDINEPDQVAALRRRLAGRRFDLLFVNAGIANDPAETIGTVSTETFTRVMVTNALSPMRVVEAFQPMVPASGTIGVMSSGLGSVADNEDGGWEVYRASKAALNTLMRSFAARHAGDPRSFLIISPGWVKTDMGGPEASLDVETSTRAVIDTIIGQRGKPGLQYLNYDGRTIRW
jgi:NAD(P)-dependent dehydrogenase (short-subunit alcohol dehydrogenase family)